MIPFPCGLFAGSGSTPVDPDAQDYFDRVVGNGGTLNATEQSAVNDFVIALKADSLWTLLRRMNPMLGNGLLACAVPLVNTKGATLDTLTGYAAGDFNRTSGLQGTGAAYLDTGWSMDLTDSTTGFAAVCFRGTTITAGTKYLAAATDSTAPQHFYELGHLSTAIGMAGYYGGTNRAPSGSLGTDCDAAIWSTGRASGTDLETWRDNVSVATNATATTPAAPGFNWYVGARNLDGAANGFLAAGERVAGYLFADALDSTERANLQTHWDAFNTALGR